MSINRWVCKLWYMHAIEYYSAMKRNKSPIDVTTWMNLKIIMLSERSQEKRAHTMWFHLYKIPHQWPGVEGGMDAKKHMKFLGWWRCPECSLWQCIHGCVGLPKLIKLFLLKRYHLLYINYISMNLIRWRPCSQNHRQTYYRRVSDK